ncbi:AsnC family transcriptional regulator [Candidatus Woesearchaeota archaeon]|nr:AsnC family transcriptional regulator [Candidatus Woesearchaeota archaeon]
MIPISPQKYLKLDQKSQKILQILAEDCRQSLSHIARKVRLSRASVEYRIRQLEEKSLISGYRTVIDITRLGYKKYHLFLSFPQPQQERDVLQRAKENAAVNSILTYRGNFTIEVGIMAKDDQECNLRLQSLLTNIQPNQEAMLILLDTIKSSALPIQQQIFKKKSVSIYSSNKQDLLLLQLLAENARMSTIELAQKSGLSWDSVAYRLKKLIKSQHILHFRPAINYSCLGLEMHTILLKTYQYHDLSLKLEQFLKHSPETIWIAKTLGPFNYIIYLLTEDQQQFHIFFERIREQFGEIVSSYHLLTTHTQEKYSFLAKSVVKD